jgi:hypothetical protein
LWLRILDNDGKPIAGSREGEIDVIKGDSIAHPIQGKAKLSDLKRRPVQLEFSLRDGELCAFELS